MQLPCTFCGKKVPRFPSQQINPKTGKMREVVKCKSCRKVNPTILFWRLVKKTGHPKGCWEFQGGLNRDGYGNFHHGPLGEYRAHRVSWRLANNNKPIPDGLNVCHKVECHNRKCVNPDHLYLGTASENTFDQMANGTHPSFKCHGESHVFRKLTDAAVIEILSTHKYGNAQSLADKFGVSLATVYDVLKRRSWKHIKLPDTLPQQNSPAE